MKTATFPPARPHVSVSSEIFAPASHPRGYCWLLAGFLLAGLGGWEHVRAEPLMRVVTDAESGQCVILTITLTARVDGVTIARRGTGQYGGLNTRLGTAKALAISHHIDAEGASPRTAWHRATGTWGDSPQAASVTIFEQTANSGYPADHIEFPDLAWLQPTFPRAGHRHALKKGEPLVLQYRYLIGSAAATAEKDLQEEWRSFNNPLPKP